MLRESLLIVILSVVIPRLQTTLAVTLDDNNDIADQPILEIPKYWPTDELVELGSSPLLGDNGKDDDIKRNGFWNGKRNGFWNGKRNGFWNGKRDGGEEKRNGFWNGKRSGSMTFSEDKRNGFWNGKRTAKTTGSNFLNMFSSSKPGMEQQCSPCGPGGKGQCVMYGVCCSVETGCYMLTTEADVCVSNPPTTLCGGSNRDCGKDGKCVADGICCNVSNRSCSIDPDCDVVWY